MRRFLIVSAAALFVAAATNVYGQTTPAGVSAEPGRFTVSFNGGFQVSKQDVTRQTTFTLYDEQAQIDIAQTDIEGGGILDVGAAYRFTRNLGVGASYTFLRSIGDATVTGSIPHPLLFDTFRTISHSATDLEHKETGIHVYATWLVPFTEKVDFTLSAGPSFFNVSQDFLRGITISEAPPFTSVTIDEVQMVSLKQNAVGFNVGADASYRITRMLGVGVLARYTMGTAEFTLNEGDVAEVKAGGFQIAGGVRVRFQP